MGSVDVETVALLWFMLEHGASLTVAGPTEPRPGAGKTTALHALLPFLPEKTAVLHMSGMNETFSFTHLPDIDPTTTYALSKEISDHQQFYMWGRIAHRYLGLPAQGYHLLTTVHADTIDDVLHLYQHDLCLRIEDISRLGLIVNIRLLEDRHSKSRRWLSTYFLQPQSDPQHAETILKLPLSLWNEVDDTFKHADSSILDQLANLAKSTPRDFRISLQQRITYLKDLVEEGADMDQIYEAVHQFRSREKSLPI